MKFDYVKLVAVVTGKKEVFRERERMSKERELEKDGKA